MRTGSFIWKLQLCTRTVRICLFLSLKKLFIQNFEQTRKSLCAQTSKQFSFPVHSTYIFLFWWCIPYWFVIKWHTHVNLIDGPFIKDFTCLYTYILYVQNQITYYLLRKCTTHAHGEFFRVPLSTKSDQHKNKPFCHFLSVQRAPSFLYVTAERSTIGSDDQN